MKTSLKTLSRFGKFYALVPLSICAFALSAIAPAASGQSPLPAAAQDEGLKNSITKAILANPSKAASIVAEAIAANDLEKAAAIADAVGLLFLSHPGIAEQAPEIAVAIAKAIYAKSGTLDARATASGAALSILAYHFAPHDPANSDRIVSLTTAGINASPEIDYTAKVYQVVSQTLSNLGASSTTLNSIEGNVLSGISDPAIRAQIAATAQAPGTPQLPLIATGQILPTETKVDNR